MIIERLDKMGSDLSVVNAARVSYSKIAEEMTDKNEKLIKYLVAHDHWSPFAHASAQFRIKAPIYLGMKSQEDMFQMNLKYKRYKSGEVDLKILNKVLMVLLIYHLK